MESGFPNLAVGGAGKLSDNRKGDGFKNAIAELSYLMYHISYSDKMILVSSCTELIFNCNGRVLRIGISLKQRKSTALNKKAILSKIEENILEKFYANEGSIFVVFFVEHYHVFPNASLAVTYR